MQAEIVDNVTEADRRDASAAQTTTTAQGEGGEEGEEDEDQIDLAHIQSFAESVARSIQRAWDQADASRKVQHRPGHIRPQITIPKRGEKDFEPLEETVNLQEMMLQRSREALFGALQGVRGGSR
jgi:tRNA-splicing endonuclease subunit Sen54